jgi:thioredoxin-like negative regulator of GroEL
MNLEEIKEIVAKNDAVMLYFWGENCAVCDALKPKIKELFETKFPNVIQLYIDAKSQTDIAAEFSVFSIPTTIVFFDGKEFAREGRALSISAFRDKISRVYDIYFN